MKALKKVGVAIFVLYIFGCIVLYFAQEQMLFHPNPLPDTMTFRFGEERWFEMSDGVRVHTLHQKRADAKGVILYFHGNRGHARRCQRQAAMFSGYGYDVVLVDYRGYGKSEGQISSQRQMFSDAETIFDVLASEYGAANIALAGYSMGSGVSSYLASRHEIKHLFLVAPYDSITDMKDRYFPLIPDFLIKYPFDNEKHLMSTETKVTIVHGTEDTVLPIVCSEELESLDPDRIVLYPVEGGSHRGVIFSQELSRALEEVL